jgi:hypothetical protein
MLIKKEILVLNSISLVSPPSSSSLLVKLSLLLMKVAVLKLLLLNSSISNVVLNVRLVAV